MPQAAHGTLSKFTVPPQDLRFMLDKWLYFLRNAGKVEDMPQVLAAEPAIAHAFAIAKRAGLSVEELAAQVAREHYNYAQRTFEASRATAKARRSARVAGANADLPTPARDPQHEKSHIRGRC